jgi:hypothetical protein
LRIGELIAGEAQVTALPFTDVPIRSSGSLRRPGGVRRFTRIVGFFGMLAAAVRIARAVEAHRDPDLEDLQVLGISEKLPKAW